MRKGLLMLAAVTMIGRISDSICASAHHPAEEHGAPGMPDHECTVACIRGGASYVLISDGKVYAISDQNSAAVQANAGKLVQLTGEVNGTTLRVSGVRAMAERQK